MQRPLLAQELQLGLMLRQAPVLLAGKPPPLGWKQEQGAAVVSD
jgi:hypothetical protein